MAGASAYGIIIAIAAAVAVAVVSKATAIAVYICLAVLTAGCICCRRWGSAAPGAAGADGKGKKKQTASC